ncbi:MAG TPA: lysophospholipid acyltransferase family protein [Solirubrobacteraceae bacterium]|nr:lysophospholipid acyltransferase family protein [Solirubrobacteraceae bacterium]
MSDDPDGSEVDTGATVELALSDLEAAPAVRRSDLRDQLPGIEPERHVTDWGRSERVEGLVDRTVYDFFYRYWFRVVVEGIENIPADGGALLVANHSGAIPTDGPMIAKAVKEEHPRPRPVHLTSERPFSGWPGVGMLLTKLGAVAAHPANLHRLLFDERQLVLVFPEGPGGSRKPVKERYRLRRFDHAPIAAALRSSAPIVPVAVLGAEEALPVLAHVGPLRRLTHLPRVPVAPVFPLPAKFKIRFLEPVATDETDELMLRDPEHLQTLTADLRALIQENLLEMVAERRSVWLG